MLLNGFHVYMIIPVLYPVLMLFPSFSHHFPIFPSFSHHFLIIFPSFSLEIHGINCTPPGDRVTEVSRNSPGGRQVPTTWWWHDDSCCITVAFRLHRSIGRMIASDISGLVHVISAICIYIYIEIYIEIY